MDTPTSSPLQTFVDRLPVGAVIASFNANDPVILAANRKHAKLTGYRASEVVGKSPRMFKGELTEKDVSAEIKDEIAKYHFANVEVTNHKPDGTPYRINLTVLGVVIDDQKYYLAVKRPI